MKPIITGVLASVAALGLLSACGGDDKITVPAATTVPTGLTVPAGVSIPSDLSVPEQAIDLMISQLEAAGMKVDKACFTALLTDDSLRQLVAAGGTPSPEVIQKFISCVTP